ncbi:hypothetical protein Nepgr_016830 [Nepenthes gracilis]|uniref:Uncharacterized protein n=1 Tax=Nepenthes gracilis TaxID=150966 RepID=A0AAD3SQE9_NEPGR|nr:hypothetical protein Nepgr_016830 [Nepenthes gracilis]
MLELLSRLNGQALRGFCLMQSETEDFVRVNANVNSGILLTYLGRHHEQTPERWSFKMKFLYGLITNFVHNFKEYWRSYPSVKEYFPKLKQLTEEQEQLWAPGFG